MSKKMLLSIFSTILFFGAVSFPTVADPVEDKQALLDFFNNIHPSHSLNWNPLTSVCNSWTGVTCNSDNSSVIALRLPGVGFRGSIPPNTLSRLSAVRILSLRSNAISGSFPSDFSKLTSLTMLYLQFNNLSGPLPWDFSVWSNLTVVDLSNNGFNGSIPPSISNLTHLTALNLSNNLLSGHIPDINVPSLQHLNLSNNNLTGNVPKSLERFPSWAFFGNNISSEDHALPPALPLQPPRTQPSEKKSKKLSQPAILAIVIGSCVLGFVTIALLMICWYSKKEREGVLSSRTKLQNKKQGTTSTTTKKNGATDHESEDKNNRLVFFEDCSLAFDLEDLLRASAEVLGKGTFGITYKAALEDSTTTVVVKRLKDVSAGKREFELQMEIVGSIRHAYVCALRAYYNSKDEKLMVYDYYQQGSVSAMLHGERLGDGKTPLDWETRLKIAIGAARGIAHIHTFAESNGGKLVHGNIKASNIFLNTQGYGSVSDTGLAMLMPPSSSSSSVMRAAGYRAPEITDARKATQASDVYSYGILLLELLTGKSPVHTTTSATASATGDEVVHLVRWVNSVVREEWTAEVFDVELLRYPNIEEEMVAMLQVGMTCVVRMPEQRPNMFHVLKMVEEIRRVSTPPNNNQSSTTNQQIVVSTPTPEIGSISTATL